MQADFYTIKNAASQLKVSEHTLRYYERIGLLQTHRLPNGYRGYTPETIELLWFIQHLKATGMPLKDIKQLLRLKVQGDTTLPERKKMIVKHRQAVLKNIAQLQSELKKIDEKVAYYTSKIEGE